MYLSTILQVYELKMYPHVTKEIPKVRGNMTEKSKITFVLGFILVVMGCAGGDREASLQNACSLCVYVACVVEALAAAEVVVRLLNVPEERRHLVSRHRGSYRHLLASLLVFPAFAILLVAATVCTHLLIYQFGYGEIYPFSILQICAIFISWFLLDLVNIKKNPVSDSVFLDKLKGLDYGSGMAQSFFYGYLHLCLPDKGNQEKGLVERIEDYISEQKLPPESFPVKRLFVLIPASSYIHNNLKDASYGWMQQQGPLQKQVKDRAGVIGRVYNNSVYRIKDPDNNDDEAIYVVAEGATPCKTLYEVIQHSGSQKDLYMEHCKDILLRFYLTLVETVKEHSDCSHLCEFIYYIDKDENGEIVNIAHLITQRLLKIKENELSTREQHRRQWQGRREPPEGRTE